jgi:Ricin-type beta-trefoil lectin domain
VIKPCPSSPEPSALWQVYAGNKIRNLERDRCLDANDHKQPILYQCYPSENTNQEWETEFGLLKNERSGTCLDFRPFEEVPLVSSACDASRTVWSKFGQFEPEETRMYREAVQTHSWDAAIVS